MLVRPRAHSFKLVGIPNHWNSNACTAASVLRATQRGTTRHPTIYELVYGLPIDIAIHLQQSDDALPMASRGQSLVCKEAAEEDVQQAEERDDTTAKPMGAHVRFQCRVGRAEKVSRCMEQLANPVARAIAPTMHLFVARMDDIGAVVTSITLVAAQDHSSG